MTGYAKAHSSFNTFLTPLQYAQHVPVLKKTDNEKKGKFNRNIVKFCLHFCAVLLENACHKWKFYQQKKKGKKNIDYQVCGNTNLLLHNSSRTNCYCTEIVLSKLAPQNRHYNFLNFLK